MIITHFEVPENIHTSPMQRSLDILRGRGGGGGLSTTKKYFIKQLLDEVEHDIMNYQNRGLCYLPKPKAEADNTDFTGLRNQADVELDMINAISAADIAFIMSSSQLIECSRPIRFFTVSLMYNNIIWLSHKHWELPNLEFGWLKSILATV